MKRTAITVAVLFIASWAVAQNSGQPAQQNPSATGQTTAPAQGTATTPAQGKRPPQAKTQPEFEAYKTAAVLTDPAALEKAADDFATKYADSELRGLLYKACMRVYQSVNNSEKTEAMGRKVLALDADDPEALVIVSEVIAEKTRDSDLDKDQRYADAIAMAKKATETVETDISVPAGTPQDKIEAYKGLLRSNAYSILGTIEFKKENFPGAQEALQKSIDAFPSQPDAVVVLRLALALDKQQKYPEALKVIARVIELAPENTQVGQLGRRERDRLQQLTGATPAPAQPQNQPPKN